MRTWKEDVPGCFGSMDAEFAMHPCDEERAFDLLTRLREEDVAWAQVQAELFSHLKHSKWGTNQQHCEKQIERARMLYEPWLSAD